MHSVANCKNSKNWGIIWIVFILIIITLKSLQNIEFCYQHIIGSLQNKKKIITSIAINAVKYFKLFKRWHTYKFFSNVWFFHKNIMLKKPFWRVKTIIRYGQNCLAVLPNIQNQKSMKNKLFLNNFFYALNNNFV